MELKQKSKGLFGLGLCILIVPDGIETKVVWTFLL